MTRRTLSWQSAVMVLLTVFGLGLVFGVTIGVMVSHWRRPPGLAMARGQALDLLGQDLGCWRQKGESDRVYRMRLRAWLAGWRPS